MAKKIYDIIVIGCGSGGLSIGLFMSQAGFDVLMVSKSDRDIGGDCLNDGCVPSKALLHVSRLIRQYREAKRFGLQTGGATDMREVMNYINGSQETIRTHENAAWLRGQGADVALGLAHFVSENEIEVEGKRYSGKKIVIATGSKPRKLKVPGVEQVWYLDNESVFKIEQLPARLLVVGGGPIGMEIAQAMSRLGSSVTIVHRGGRILPHDDSAVTAILAQTLEKEGIEFIYDAEVAHFSSANEAVVKSKKGNTITLAFDAVFVAVGRQLNIDALQLQHAGIDGRDGKIAVNRQLRTSNKNVYVCGDAAGDLQFSHVAEFHARILLNNFFSPVKQKLVNDHLSWVTFTDPEIASFGLNEKQLKDKGVDFERLDQDFMHDDRAVVDNYRYGKLVLFVSKKRLFSKQRILGGAMAAPQAGELVQELILANSGGLSINAIFHKIYPYPVAARINQQAIVNYKQRELTTGVKKLLRIAFTMFK